MNPLKSRGSTLLLLALFFSTLLVSQNSGILKVYTIPQNAIIQIGTATYESGKPIELDTGTYEVKIWAPTRELVTKQVKIGNGFYKTVSVELQPTKEYKSYRLKLHAYNFSRFSMRYGPILAYGIIAGSKLIQNSNLNADADRYEQEALMHKQAYEDSFWELDLLSNRTKFDNTKDKYTNAVNQINKNSEFIIYGAGAAVVLNFVTWKLSKKLKRPEFSEEPKLARLDIIPTLTVQSTGLYIKLQF